MSSIAELHPDTFLHAVLDEVGVAMVAVDAEGRFSFVNRAALQMFGLSESPKGLPFREVRRDLVFRDDQGRPIAQEQSSVIRALAGEQVSPQNVEVILPDGQTKFLHSTAHAFSVFGVRGVLVMITDETEEIVLRRALERAQSIQVLGLLVAGLAHDLNNMISVVSGNVALLQTDQSVPETAQTRLKQMTAALQRGATLAKNLVRYSRAQQVQPRPAQINDLVNVALELVQPMLKSRVHVKIELGSLPAVEVDPSQIEQVLANLMLNALDAMPQGGELTLRTELVDRATVNETELDDDEGKRATSFVRVTVADTGIGIPEEVQTYIFDPFFTTKAKERGSGLGLASAYAVMRQHSGHIKVESVPGAGAKFSIYLPVKEKISANLTRAA